MRRIRILGVALLTIFYFSVVPAWAQHGHSQSHPSGPPASQGSNGSHGMSGMQGMQGQMGNHGNMGDMSGMGMNHMTNANQPTVADQLSRNTKLASRLSDLLPKGTDLQTAAAGFKNLGDFVAAVHVAHNLNIPFVQLRGELVGPEAKKLGEAIHTLKPDVNAKAEAKKAEKQAKKTVKETKQSGTAS